MNHLCKKALVFVLAVSAFWQSLPIYAKYPKKYTDSLYYKMDRKEFIKNGIFGESKDWIESGNFYYEIINSGQGKLQKQYITIRRVKEAAVKNGVLTIPATVDNYPVLGVGAFGSEPDPYIPPEHFLTVEKFRNFHFRRG